MEKQKAIQLTPQQNKEILKWAADDSWMKQLKYLEDDGYLNCVRDILEHPVFQSMDQYIQHGHTTCMNHCIQVSYLSYRICRRYGWNAAGAARAGLLHDMFLYDWHTHAKETGDYFHGYTHPKTALNNASRYFDLTSEESDMILCHMWPLTLRPPKTMAGMSIVYADKVCSLSEVFNRLFGQAAWRLRRL